MLYDNHGRIINYVRLAVTDRCNLRCFYCMPEKGIDFVKRRNLLTFEEIQRLLKILASQGITKVRITGGEPFVRKGILGLLKNITTIPGIDHVHITTNGTFTHEYIPVLEDMGIESINLSLDSLDRNRFEKITRRDVFPDVMKTLDRLLESSIEVKINMVVMEGKNIEDILPMLELTRHHSIAVRFIEEMPFNGTAGQGNSSYWPVSKIMDYILQAHPQIIKQGDPPHSTSSNYRITGYKGTFGMIAAFSRTFCGSCNRIRITPQGEMRTCLYGDSVLDFRELIRSGIEDEQIIGSFKEALGKRFINGFEAEENRSNNQSVSESMATIGG